LEWGAAASDATSPLTGYVVKRGLSPATMEAIAEPGDVLTYLDEDVVNGIIYYYSVTALNSAGSGSPSDVVSAKPEAPYVPPVEVLAPSEPGSIEAELDDNTVLITWTPPASDGGSPITGYVVMRGTSQYDPHVVAEVELVLLYLDENLEPGTTYYYTIAAVNDVGQGDHVEEVEVVVKKPKDKDNGPGFPMLMALIALALVIISRWPRDRKGFDREGWP
jgi:hypothetical protein